MDGRSGPGDAVGFAQRGVKFASRRAWPCGCSRVLPVRAFACRPASESSAFPQAPRRGTSVTGSGWTRSKELERTAADRTHALSILTATDASSCPPACRRHLRGCLSFFATAPGSPLPAARRPAHKKDLTAAGEWHTYHATPRCGVHVGK